MSDLVQHIMHFWNKMVVHSRNDQLTCLTFPSSLKGVASIGSTLCRPNFEEITKAFLTQYASSREAKKNNHHLLTVKMR